MKENHERERVIEVLKENPKGLTILKISKIIGKSRTTVSKYVYGLVSEGLVYQREIGPAKLCYLKSLKGNKNE